MSALNFLLLVLLVFSSCSTTHAQARRRCNEKKFGSFGPWRPCQVESDFEDVETPMRVGENIDGVETVANLSIISNDKITLGVDLNRGGSITYLSLTGVNESVINVFDMGREVQLSFYGGPNDYEPSPGSTACKSKWRPQGTWPWNPIGAGDDVGHGGKVLQYKNEGTQLYIQSRPLQWACDNVPCECTFEKWIYVGDSNALVVAKLNNHRADKTFYGAYGQELPAVYTIGSLYRLISYNETKPWTNDKTTEFATGSKLWTPGAFLATEHWAALVNDSGWGLGVLSPGNYHITGGFAGKPGSGGPHDSPTGYIAPNYIEVLDHDIQYTFMFFLILGDLKDIRAKAYQVHNAQPEVSTLCLLNDFREDRQHWRPINAMDNGVPNGNWHVIMEKDDPQLIGPTCFWYAEDYPVLHVNASYSTKQASPKGIQGEIFLNNVGIRSDFLPSVSVRFDVITDGQYHMYKVPLSSQSFYHGPMFGMRFDPVDQGTAGCFVDLVSVYLSKT